MTGGYARPGEQQSPYPEYQDWRPQGAPGGYPAPDGYGEPVNGGGYAYVIREDDRVVPEPSRARPRERGQGLGEWSPANAGPAAGHPAGPGAAARSGKSPDAAGAVRAITAGAADTQWPADAFGPPGTVRTATSGGADPAEAAIPAGASDWYEDEFEGTARGPFEPLRAGEYGATGYADYRPADDEPALDGHDDDLPDISEYQSLDYEMPELLDFGTSSDPEAGALGQLKDLYLTAETISPAGLDGHFDQLLERQRQLISEYFAESGGVGSAEPGLPATPPDPPSSAVTIAFDTAESQAALRGDPRSAP